MHCKVVKKLVGTDPILLRAVFDALIQLTSKPVPKHSATLNDDFTLDMRGNRRYRPLTARSTLRG